MSYHYFDSLIIGWYTGPPCGALQSPTPDVLSDIFVPHPDPLDQSPVPGGRRVQLMD